MSMTIKRRCVAAEALTPSATASFPPYSPARFLPLPEDIVVAEILPRLHIKALFKFKCVSKLYNFIISNPEFARNFMQLSCSSPETSLVALLYPFTDLSKYQGCFSNKVKDLASTKLERVDVDQLSMNVSTFSLPDKGSYKIIGSSNGLILSHTHSDYEHSTSALCEPPKRMVLCVSNPLTEQTVCIPKSTIPWDKSLHLFIATRRDQATTLTYKIVIVHCPRMLYFFHPHPWQYASATIEIFSSDTGRWAFQQVDCPTEVFKRTSTTARASFSYKGILHWLDHSMRTVITYDTYDRPNQFGCIPLPSSCQEPQKKVRRSLIYSGDDEMIKYCEIKKGSSRMLSLWRLVDSVKGEWCFEGNFQIPPLIHGCKGIMVAPYRWSRDVICHPYAVDQKVMIMNVKTGRRKYKKLFVKGTWSIEFSHYEDDCYGNPLIPVEMCPWSSPFYAQLKGDMIMVMKQKMCPWSSLFDDQSEEDMITVMERKKQSQFYTKSRVNRVILNYFFNNVS